jgi:deazaflavin-dependent oxidoreductase (nitroreductase family)
MAYTKIGYSEIIPYALSGGLLYFRPLDAPVGLLRVTTTGRKSGKQRASNLLYIRDGDAYVITASNGGSSKHPGWYYNVRNNPQVAIKIKNQHLQARAEVASPEKRKELWERLLKAAPFFANYEKTAGREIPMVLLHPA